MSDLLYSPHGVTMATDTVEIDLESRTPRYFCSYSLDFVPIPYPPIAIHSLATLPQSPRIGHCLS